MTDPNTRPADRYAFDLVIRRVPGHHWVRPFVSWGDCDRGHGWLYGCVRRDAWRIGRLGFGLLRMPYRRFLPAHMRTFPWEVSR